MLGLLRRLLTKLVAVAFMAWGGFLIICEFLNRSKSENIIFGYALGVVFLLCGVVMCVAVACRYRGGIGAFVGLILIAWGMIGVAGEWERRFHGDGSSRHNYAMICISFLAGAVMLMRSRQERAEFSYPPFQNDRTPLP